MDSYSHNSFSEQHPQNWQKAHYPNFSSSKNTNNQHGYQAGMLGYQYSEPVMPPVRYPVQASDGNGTSASLAISSRPNIQLVANVSPGIELAAHIPNSFSEKQISTYPIAEKCYQHDTNYHDNKQNLSSKIGQYSITQKQVLNSIMPPTTETHDSPKYPDYAEETERLNTYFGWTLIDPSPTQLSRAGLFYTGDGDMVRCFQCGLGLKYFNAGDNPMKEHIKYENGCQFLLNELGHERLFEMKKRYAPTCARQSQANIQMPNTETFARNLVQRQSSCQTDYQSLNARISSFSKWPKNHNQTPKQLAEAGFYYTGCGDNVRCFSCQGGLCKWDPEDDPWLEHCKWYPHCTYAREQKGRDFIAFVQASVVASQEPIGDNDHRAPETTTPPVNEDISQMMQHTTIQDNACIAMGYSTVEVNEAIQELLNQGQVHPAVENIIDQIEINRNRSNLQQAIQQQKHQVKGTVNKQEKSSSILQTQPESVVDENIRLKSLLLCNSCHQNEINALFLPCAHHKFCMVCSKHWLVCPVCKKQITEKVKTFMS